jgi:predicted ATPase
VVEAQADALLTLASAQGFPLFVGFGMYWRGWALAMQGQGEAGLALLRQGMAAVLATGQELTKPTCLILLAERAKQTGEVTEGLRLLTEALTTFETSGRGDMLTEVYRLQGELLLCQATPDAAQAEACFQQALAIARRQQVKSWRALYEYIAQAPLLSTRHMLECLTKPSEQLVNYTTSLERSTRVESLSPTSLDTLRSVAPCKKTTGQRDSCVRCHR